MVHLRDAGRYFILMMAIAFASHAAQAEVTGIEIASRTDVLGGKPFGDAGAYEKIIGKVHFAVDPASPANQRIVDINKASRDSAGRVRFSADLCVLVPKEMTRANGAVLFDVLNRGRKNMLVTFNRAPPRRDPTAEADFGDGFLMRQGFTLVWVGWQFDIPSRDGLMGLDAPAVIEDSHPVVGQVTTSFVPNTRDPSHALAELGRYADTSRYRPIDPAGTANMLSVRDGFLGAAHMLPADRWSFDRIGRDSDIGARAALVLKDGFEPGHVYELTYEAQGAVVSGLGFAALRDLASALKHGATAPFAQARYAYAFGPSQDGRLLREFMYEGFNADERGERVFDGVIAHIAGAARGGDFNARFARPNGLGYFVATLFPFLDTSQKDPITGKSDGLLTHLTAEQQPKIFYTNSSTEYWGGGRAAALTHTTLGGSDAQLPDNVRIYLFAGTQHVPGGFLPSQGPGQQQANPNDYAWGERALLVALDRWVRDGIEPPASRYPRLADETLVAQAQLDFPALPGVHSPANIPGPYRADLPGLPAEHPLPFLVPNVDRDGNETAGIRLPDVAVPLATYTGWNFRNPSIGEPDQLLPLTGSYIPFAATRAAREQAHDPRPSLEERYSDRATYEARVNAAATELVAQNYLLAEDQAAIVARAMARWDGLTQGTSLAGR
jgi:Alpha/beta hydrolase domain